jgi:hypothetical protein
MTPAQNNTVNGYANLASGLSSVYNAYQEGKLNSIVAKHNATMAGYEKEWVDIKMDQQFDVLYDDEARYLGAARAIHSGSGFSVASETNKEIDRDIMRNIGREANIIRINGGLEKMRIDSKISTYKSQADTARTAGNIKAVTALSQTARSKGFSTVFNSSKRN